MDPRARRTRLAQFIDSALEPPILFGRPLARIPIPAPVLRASGETMRDIADRLRDPAMTVDPAALSELECVLTRAGSSPLYGNHPLRALHVLVGIESRLTAGGTSQAA
jgi:hypothetical protein